ncbi:glycosyltransferase family 9 protein [Phorcysia thermohydrogeniphila]|uniref:ADP-heptose:LPS heptosyltransferase n=1 Tax=Phorcysia thermohydrogeniphila TaxID=936138 RepID=A0A4R1G6M8_9BACT|nr:glycosyltransferase family 9 protein [Phorcysia thermohydrogeniphila]TCK03334.1 ADP-heptose:LPS heptosyltransferase [Phorcysia thermohydrogeniphila]
MRALVIRLSSLGDVILVSSVLSPLKRAGIEIDLLTYAPFGELYRGDSRVSRVIEVKKERLKSFSAIKELAGELSGYSFAFDLHATLKTRLLTKFFPFPVYTYKKHSILRRLMIVFKPLKSRWLFVPELYAEAVRKAGIEVENPRPEIPVSEKEKSKVRKYLPPSPFVVVAPGARWETKRYPLEKFLRVALILKKRGFSVVSIGGKEDNELGEFLRERAGALNLCGKLSLRESLAVISSSVGVISNDSAVLHMGRAVKVPVLAIFGPTHPAFGFAPYKDEGIALTKNLPCSPCSIHGRTRCKYQKCFDLPPEEIVEKFFSLVESAEKRR